MHIVLEIAIIQREDQIRDMLQDPAVPRQIHMSLYTSNPFKCAVVIQRTRDAEWQLYGTGVIRK